MYHKSYEGFGDIPLLEWFFYYDNDQLSPDRVRRNWEIQQLKEKHDKLQFKFSLNCNLKIDILYINYEQL
jgi:hypothetical protein